MSWLLLLPLAALTGHTLINAMLLRRPPRDAVVTERVAVLLPLRNEADRVTPCLQSLLSQRGVPHLEIYVLDDGSTDHTAEVVRHQAGDKVHLLTGAPLPPGWLGKPHACHQLAAAAADADVLVLIDADVVLADDAVAGGVAALRSAGVTLLSPYPRIAGAGRLVQPLLQWSWLTFLPVRVMERSPRPSLAAAGGQWLVVDRAGYLAAGGHEAVRADVLEDIGLARAVKRSGGRIALADGSRLATCHMYATWRELADGYSKSLWASLGSPAGAATVVVLLLLLYALPPLAVVVLAAAASWSAAAGALVAYAMGVAGRMISAAATGGRTWPDPLAQPISVVLFGWLVARSFALRRRGALTWRGRAV
ncbi:glycosyltransferase family 2 protein [Actinoplanes sp. N902-109]|uniref:glycosyltransferase n=1 Tax=Actinoplanes sp. (strain N902-109) TaxID=649831 RepID=UPI0003296674|nr:glycosyltransferase [Actinoplanes sp. N902-109]AGL15480.1 glycosyl transferase family protein [Actinoplanes sp. N902-109]